MAIAGIAIFSFSSCHEPDCPDESQFINVTDYGVIPDDSIDDTDSIRNVFLTIRDANKHATIFFPEGTYLIDPSKDKSMEIVGNWK